METNVGWYEAFGNRKSTSLSPRARRDVMDIAMPWKIVNLDYAGDHPHLHLQDPSAPIHLRSFFDGRVEIGLGADEPEQCFVRATVTPDRVIVEATRFQPLHLQILQSILASLDVEPDERDEALAWMRARLTEAQGRAEQGFLRGNLEAFPPPTGWPYDLADDALLDCLRDDGALPSTRVRALEREAERRGLAVARRRNPPAAPSPGRTAGPEVIRRR